MVDTNAANAPAENPAVRYERTDVGWRWILGIGLTSLIVGVLINLGLLWFLEREKRYYDEARSTTFPIMAEEREHVPPGPGSHPLNGGLRAGQHDPLPPEPRLDPINIREGLPEASVAEMYARDEAILHSYGPSTEKGFFHIPIERAMALLEGKLPVKPEPPEESKRDQGLLDWGRPNSGHLLRGPSNEK
jgi:hypothetical protein